MADRVSQRPILQSSSKCFTELSQAQSPFSSHLPWAVFKLLRITKQLSVGPSTLPHPSTVACGVEAWSWIQFPKQSEVFKPINLSGEYITLTGFAAISGSSVGSRVEAM